MIPANLHAFPVERNITESLLLHTYLSLVVFGTFVGAAIAQTDSSTAQTQQEVPTPIVAVMADDSSGAEKPSDLCSLYPGTTLKAGRPIIVIAERDCKSRYGSEVTRHYEVAVGGKRFFVDKSAIKLSALDQEKAQRLASETRDQYFEKAALLSIQVRRQEFGQLLKAIEATRKAGLTIVKASIADVSEYTEGTSFSIKVINPTDKPIKYIWFTVIGYNAVNDPVRDRLKGGPSLTVKAIGPIEKDESGSYKWEYMWHTDIVESFKISEIKVQYMDSSTRMIRDWTSIALSTQNRRVLEEND